MELPGGGGVWLAPSPSLPGPAVPDRHDEHGVGTFIWPPAGTSTWPPVGTFSWPRTTCLSSQAVALGAGIGDAGLDERVDRGPDEGPRNPRAPDGLTRSVRMWVFVV